MQGNNKIYLEKLNKHSKRDKVKNQCKVCLKNVKNKMGLRSKGPYRNWINFDCLTYVGAKIQAIKHGNTKTSYPCPVCTNEARDNINTYESRNSPTYKLLVRKASNVCELTQTKEATETASRLSELINTDFSESLCQPNVESGLTDQCPKYSTRTFPEFTIDIDFQESPSKSQTGSIEQSPISSSQTTCAPPELIIWCPLHGQPKPLPGSTKQSPKSSWIPATFAATELTNCQEKSECLSTAQLLENTSPKTCAPPKLHNISLQKHPSCPPKFQVESREQTLKSSPKTCTLAELSVNTNLLENPNSGSICQLGSTKGSKSSSSSIKCTLPVAVIDSPESQCEPEPKPSQRGLPCSRKDDCTCIKYRKPPACTDMPGTPVAPTLPMTPPEIPKCVKSQIPLKKSHSCSRIMGG